MVKVTLYQSCGIPLDDKVPRSTKNNGTLSEKYCIRCYKNGEWTLHLEFDEMYNNNGEIFLNENVYKKIHKKN